jgi:hypothetical protein
MQMNIQFAEAQSNLVKKLSGVLDEVELMETALDALATPLTVAAPYRLFSFRDEQSRAFDDIKSDAHSWLQIHFFQDCLDSVGTFVEELLATCAIVDIAHGKSLTIEEMQNGEKNARAAHNKLNAVDKLAKLKTTYGMNMSSSEKVLSLNKLRNCLVHRQGIISEKDQNDAAGLTIEYYVCRVTVTGIETGVKTIFYTPHMVATEESTAEVEFIESKKTFPLGTRIALDKTDLSNVVLTLVTFSDHCTQEIQAYAKARGIQFPNLPPSTHA